MGLGASRSRGSPFDDEPKSRKQNVDLSKFVARVDRVDVGGLERTHDDYVNRAVRNLFRATTFNEVISEVKTSMQQLEKLGIFKSIRASIDVSRGPEATDSGYVVTFDGVELKRVTGKVGTEVGQNEGAVTGEISSPNVFGRGERLSLHGSYSNCKTTDVNIKLTKPFYHTFLGDLQPETSVILSKFSAECPWSKYRTEHLGLILDTSFQLPALVHHSVQAETSFRELNVTAKQVPLELRKHCGPRMATVLRYTMTVDERDSSVFPTTGALLRSTNEVAGLFGGNIGYASTNAHAELNVPLFRGLSLQLCGRAGVITPSKMAPPVPINNLFTLGGPQSLRGFAMAGANEHIDGVAMGAHTYMALGAHLWSPLPFFNRSGIANLFRLHVSLNCGKTDSFALDASNLAGSLGVGMAMSLGERARIEFNYCEPLTSRNAQYFKKGFQFGIGFDFI